jgi:Transcription elongation factor, GreA/GreB, C-term
MTPRPALTPALSATVTKEALKEELAARLREQLEILERAHESARAAATHEEAKPENDKDTRALEQSYIARGQALRVEEVRGGLADVEAMPLRSFSSEHPVALGALLVAEEEGGAQRAFFLAPHGGGTSLAGGSVQVLTPQSPLGRAFLGKRVGDDCQAQVAGRTLELSVLEVR